MTVLIAATRRSPFTAVDGALARWHPVDLAAEIMNATLAESDLDPGDIGEVWIGCADPVGAQGANMARAAILATGWPDRISGVVVDRAETSGGAALHGAVAAIESGAVEMAVVVGACSASIVQPGAAALGRVYGRPWGDSPAARVVHEGGLLPAPILADRAAVEAGIERGAQDAWATRSHERRAGQVAEATVEITARPGEGAAVQRGAPIRTDERREAPADPSALPPCFDPDGAVSAFTFAPPVDGATALVLVSAADQPHVAITGTARSAGHPLDPLGGLEAAAGVALRGAGLTIADVDRWELTEPTAAAALVAIQRLDLDPDRVNRFGGTLGVGDAGAAEELRLVVDSTEAADPGSVIVAASFGPGGSAVTVLRCP